MGSRAFIKDFSWYFFGSFLPIAIGLIKTPIFTRHFDKESFGHLGLITITFSYFGMLFFSWIASCIWRYYHKHKEENSLDKLYSSLTFLVILSSMLVVIIAAAWYVWTENDLAKQLIFYSIFQLIFNQMFLCYMVVIRLQGKARFYTIFQSVKSILAIALALVLVFEYSQNISALILSLAIIDGLAILFLILANPAKVVLNAKSISRITLQELLVYGSAGLIINIGLLIITSSDRYIIAWLSTIENVGIYDQVYKISQLSVWALVTIFFNTINPYLLNQLERHFKKSDQLIRKYLKAMLLYGLPIIVYLCLFSKDIATILLGEAFREGYVIMPFVFFAAYLHGISNFYELRLKFTDKLKRLTGVILVSVCLNIIITYVLVMYYGYKSAAVTTVLIYMFMLIIFHMYDRSLWSFHQSDKTLLLKILVVIAVQASLFILLTYYYQVGFFYKLLLGFLFIVSYLTIFKKQLQNIDIPVHD